MAAVKVLSPDPFGPARTVRSGTSSREIGEFAHNRAMGLRRGARMKTNFKDSTVGPFLDIAALAIAIDNRMASRQRLLARFAHRRFGGLQKLRGEDIDVIDVHVSLSR